MRNLRILFLILLFIPIVSSATRYKPYTALQYKIDQIETEGDLNLTFFRGDVEYKGQKLYRVSESGAAGYKDFQPKPVAGVFHVPSGTVPLEAENHLINLKSHTANVSLCYWAYKTRTEICGQSISFNWKEAGSISIVALDSWETLLNEKGISAQDEILADVMSFSVGGDIAGDSLTVNGKFFYDNTQESKEAYKRGIRFSENLPGYAFLGIIVIILFLLSVFIRSVLKRIRKR
jgi:hypothetical protein